MNRNDYTTTHVWPESEHEATPEQIAELERRILEELERTIMGPPQKPEPEPTRCTCRGVICMYRGMT